MLQVLAARFIFEREAAVDAVKLDERRSKPVLLRLGVWAERKAKRRGDFFFAKEDFTRLFAAGRAEQIERRAAETDFVVERNERRHRRFAF